jgi:hypothetical protein
LYNDKFRIMNFMAQRYLSVILEVFRKFWPIKATVARRQNSACVEPIGVEFQLMERSCQPLSHCRGSSDSIITGREIGSEVDGNVSDLILYVV